MKMKIIPYPNFYLVSSNQLKIYNTVITNVPVTSVYQRIQFRKKLGHAAVNFTQQCNPVTVFPVFNHSGFVL